MKLGDRIHASVLATRVISRVHDSLAERLKLRTDQLSIALITADIDDVLYVALDEATKKAEVEVVYANSFYAGSDHASGPLSGEIIGILAGPNPAEAAAGLAVCVEYAETQTWFESANYDGSLSFFAHPISRTGSYLSAMAGMPAGTPLAYLIAPPLEATYGLDQALKTADIYLREWFAPPSETNFSGGLLVGDQSAVVAACSAFRAAVIEIANKPREI